MGLSSTLYLSFFVSVCLCLFVSLCLGHCYHLMISSQKIYSLYGLEHYIVETNAGQPTKGATQLLWILIAEFAIKRSLCSVMCACAHSLQCIVWIYRVSFMFFSFLNTALWVALSETWFSESATRGRCTQSKTVYSKIHSLYS